MVCEKSISLLPEPLKHGLRLLAVLERLIAVSVERKNTPPIVIEIEIVHYGLQLQALRDLPRKPAELRADRTLSLILHDVDGRGVRSQLLARDGPEMPSLAVLHTVDSRDHGLTGVHT